MASLPTKISKEVSDKLLLTSGVIEKLVMVFSWVAIVGFVVILMTLVTKSHEVFKFALVAMILVGPSQSLLLTGRATLLALLGSSLPTSDPIVQGPRHNRA